MNNDDAYYEVQILEANKICNALLSGIVMESVSDLMNNSTLPDYLKHYYELVKLYSEEIEKLKSLQIVNCHEALKMKNNKSSEIHIAQAGALLDEIDGILKSNIKHSASHVISKSDLETLKDQKDKLMLIFEKINNIPKPNEELKSHLQTINNIHTNLEHIGNTISTTSSQINKSQIDVIDYTTDVLHLSKCFCAK
ncbi:CLUMA_CG006191, isoform A [Clunio marinus]|uniref:CLUMA_CG006191, isoform A n=1 Tax=Clunio marinus TaxID=568069 RepID=A0A1J1HX62_9DIPT|nr:CLUMA_CG006191, isoform A [Clunio marinus]